MIIKINSSIGTIVFVMRNETKQRLVQKCFRQNVCLAGNFSLWENAYDVIQNRHVTRALLIDTEEALSEKSRTNSVCVDVGTFIGWSGTDDMVKYRLSVLESFEPNRKSTALRVRLDRRDLCAPQTNLVTVIYEVKSEPGQIAVIIHSLYPGKDIGELCGDVTAREQCVFFDWNHPGKQ
jgi:hypothetical protein